MAKSLLSRVAKGIKQEFKRRRMREIFTDIYLNNKWKDADSRSGPGSNQEQTATLKTGLPAMLRQLEVRSLLDIPCGDFAWMKEVDLPVERYIGADIVQEVADSNNRNHGSPVREFVCLDLTRDDLPTVDMIFCRDCLVHLPLKDIALALRNIKRSKARFVTLTTFTEFGDNEDIVSPGKWRKLNLVRAPFFLPPPVRLLDEKSPAAPDKHLGVWRVADLPESYEI
jgi:SAM-dependent methyltransferase